VSPGKFEHKVSWPIFLLAFEILKAVLNTLPDNDLLQWDPHTFSSRRISPICALSGNWSGVFRRDNGCLCGGNRTVNLPVSNYTSPARAACHGSPQNINDCVCFDLVTRLSVPIKGSQREKYLTRKHCYLTRASIDRRRAIF
jgi:hypothetical protein